MNKPQCVPQLPQSSDCEKRQDQFQEVRDATFLSLLTFVLELLGFLEAYSQTARRPAKPLIRAHLRMAVNKPPCVASPSSRPPPRVVSSPHQRFSRPCSCLPASPGNRWRSVPPGDTPDLWVPTGQPFLRLRTTPPVPERSGQQAFRELADALVPSGCPAGVSSVARRSRRRFTAPAAVPELAHLSSWDVVSPPTSLAQISLSRRTCWEKR